MKTRHLITIRVVALLLSVMSLSMIVFPIQAHATVVTVGGVDYDIQIVQGGTFNDRKALVENTPWWNGGISLASDIATAYSQLVNNVPVAFGYGYFNNGVNSVDLQFFSPADEYGDGSVDYARIGVTTDISFFGPDAYWAYGTVAASSVPEINAGSLSQALLILFALWLVVRRRKTSMSV